MQRAVCQNPPPHVLHTMSPERMAATPKVPRAAARREQEVPLLLRGWSKSGVGAARTSGIDHVPSEDLVDAPTHGFNG